MEKNRKFNLKPSPKDVRDFKLKTVLKATELPEVLDLRDIMFAIRDQGTQGSCVAMAAAAMKEYQEILDINLDEYLSPQFIYNNREDKEEGMTTRDLMKILVNYGVCLESLCKYGNLSIPSLKAYEDAVKHTIKTYGSLTTVSELKTALYTQGPCIIAVPVYNESVRMWFEKSGDYFLGGHALCVVGYDKTGFIIRNSWGKTWGDNGYCTLPYEDFSLIWEAWSTLDNESEDIVPEPPVPTPDPPEEKGCFFGRIITFIMKIFS